MLEKIFTDKMGNNCCCLPSNKIHSEKKIIDHNTHNKRKLTENEMDGLNKSIVKEKLGINRNQSINNESLDESIVVNDVRDSDIIDNNDENSCSNKSITCSCSIQNGNERRKSWSYDDISKKILSF